MKFIIVMILVAWCGLRLYAQDIREINAIYYWIDDMQDGIISIDSQEFEIDCNNLLEGLHFLHYRVSDSKGAYSQLYEHGFLKLSGNTKSDSIQTLQYWWDDMNDKAIMAPYSSDTFVLSAELLPIGLHSIKYRVEDSSNRWSECKTHYFYKGEQSDSARIVSYSYWWNDMADKAIKSHLETSVETIIFDIDLTVPEEARTGYAGNYTATLNMSVADNHGKMIYTSANIEYPDNDAPVTDIDASVYWASTKSGVKISWWEMTDDKMGDFNVYVSKDDGPFYLWLPDTKTISSMFYGESGCNYRFTVTGRDEFGNRERYDESKCVSVTFE